MFVWCPLGTLFKNLANLDGGLKFHGFLDLLGEGASTFDPGMPREQQEGRVGASRPDYP